MSEDGKLFAIFQQRCIDDDLTIPRNDNEMLANIFELKDNASLMTGREFLCHVDDPYEPIGPVFSYEGHRLTNE